MPKAQASSARIYERNVNTFVQRLDSERILTESSLLDLNHSMKVALTVNLKTLKIEEATAQILKAPLRVCDSTTALMKNIEGLSIGRGVNKKLLQLLAQDDGCTHLYELALNAVRLSYNVMIGLRFDWQEWISKTVSDEEFIQEAAPFLKGACRPFKSKVVPNGSKREKRVRPELTSKRKRS
jgi:hypothetical protein